MIARDRFEMQVSNRDAHASTTSHRAARHESAHWWPRGDPDAARPRGPYCSTPHEAEADVTLHLFERIAVEDEGEGEAVVCLHGLGGSANTWTPMMPALAHHRVIRVELPGSARSSRVEGDLSIDRLVQAAVTACERLGVTRAHWIGHSLGTIVCQHLAVQWPRLVRSLALFGPLLAPPDAARAGLRQRALKVREQGVAGQHEVALQLLQSALSRDTRERSPLAVACVRDTLMRSEPEGYARTCEALAQAQPAAVDAIRVPVLLVTGDEDVVAPPQAMRDLASRLTQASHVRQVVLPRCGHWTPLERNEACAQEWRAFAAQAARG
jgi:pimeloyl-ACP methyl ester carboxylesterase